MSSQNSLKVKFPLPDPKDPFSLKPGSVSSTTQEKRALEIEKVTSLTAAIVGAKASATQFLKKGHSLQTDNTYDTTKSKSKATEQVAAESLHNPVLGSGVKSDCTDTTRNKNKGTQMDEEACSQSSKSRVEDDTKLKVKHNEESNTTSVVKKREVRNTSSGERRFDPGPVRVRIVRAGLSTPTLRTMIFCDFWLHLIRLPTYPILESSHVVVLFDDDHMLYLVGQDSSLESRAEGEPKLFNGIQVSMCMLVYVLPARQWNTGGAYWAITGLHSFWAA